MGIYRGRRPTVCGPPAINEHGNRYGHLVVISKVPGPYAYGARWLCQCDCGNTRIAKGITLRSGWPRHCGCRNPEPKPKVYRPPYGSPERPRGHQAAIDEKNNRYERLTVLRRAPVRHWVDPWGVRRTLGASWLCQCDCGNETIVLGRNLRIRNTKSCGCLRSTAK